MRMFLLTVALLTASGAALAQPKSTFSRATPPAKESLERLNLKSDWSIFIPMSGQSDGLAKVQVLDEDHVVVQTKAGLLVVIDQHTGRQLWKFKFPAAFTSGFGVGANAKFLFAVNVAKLYCFHRYTGLLEFEFDLPEAPSASPVADGNQVYVSFTGSKVMALQLPLALQINPETIKKPGDPKVTEDNAKKPNPADVVADRYGTRLNTKTIADAEFDRRNVPPAYFESGQGLSTQQKAPSISAMPSVVPPYTIHGLNKVDSLSILPSLRQPYKLRPDYLTYNQYSPSLSVIPPSIARVHELANLRPEGVKPIMYWTIGTKQKIAYDPVLVEPKTQQLTSPRVWVTEAGKNFLAVSKRTGVTEVSGSFSAEPSGPLVGPFAYSADFLLGFVALEDGQVLGIDLTGGSAGLPRYEWKANVGGFLNHRPLATKDGVYVSGENSGVSKIDVKTGDVTWRTESGADRILSVNEEFAYVLNRRGELLVYAKDRVHDTVTKKAKALTALDVAGFNVPITNATTDRILLGADNGLIVCLRDSSAKYAKPSRVAPADKLPENVKPPVKPGEPVAPTPKN